MTVIEKLLYNTGMTTYEVSKQCGAVRQSIMRYERSGLYYRCGGISLLRILDYLSETDDELRMLLTLVLSGVEKECKETNYYTKPLKTKSVLGQIFEMKGTTPTGVAKKLGLSINTICGWVRNGIPKNSGALNILKLLNYLSESDYELRTNTLLVINDSKAKYDQNKLKKK